MTTKHIQNATWKRVEEETVKQIIRNKKVMKDTDMLNQLILLGIESLKKKDEKQEEMKV